MRRILGYLIILLLLGASFGAGFLAGGRLNRPEPPVPEFKVFWEAWDVLVEHFYGPLPDNRRMTYAAIRGVVASLQDPYTTFLEPQKRSLEKDEFKGEFGGIGAWVDKTEKGEFVLTPIEGYPAQKAGILPGDVLVRVDDTPVTPEMSLDDVVLLIRGPVGTYVTLVVRRDGQEHTFQVKRERIETPSVEWRILEPGIGYVKITTFTDRTPRELDGALQELEKGGATGLVLDLRGNPGGLVDSALEVGGFFVDGVMFYERYKDGTEKAFEARKAPRRISWPVVVLVDSQTASAAEILAGALHELKGAPLVGERTYGKGSVQLVYDLSDGSSLHVTAARWFTPHRREIEGNGLEPTVKVEPEEGTDAWLDAALRILKGG